MLAKTNMLQMINATETIAESSTRSVLLRGRANPRVDTFGDSRTSPEGVRLNIQDKVAATGNPRRPNMTTSPFTQSGRLRAGTTISDTWKITQMSIV